MQFVEIADRVHVARYPQWDISIGLIVGTRGAVLVDTRAGARQGAELLADTRALAPRITDVVNTHVHFDHTFGNIAFDTATIHAHPSAIADWNASADRIRRELQADPGDCAQYGYTAADVQDALTSALRPPQSPVAAQRVIDLGDREVTVTHAGRGHTAGDLVVSVRTDSECVAFFGDLVEQSGPPALGPDSFVFDWPHTLTRHLFLLDPGTVVVPGHGAPVDLGFVTRQRDELRIAAGVVRDRIGTRDLTLAEAQSWGAQGLAHPISWLRDVLAVNWPTGD